MTIKVLRSFSFNTVNFKVVQFNRLIVEKLRIKLAIDRKENQRLLARHLLVFYYCLNENKDEKVHEYESKRERENKRDRMRE